MGKDELLSSSDFMCQGRAEGPTSIVATLKHEARVDQILSIRKEKSIYASGW